MRLVPRRQVPRGHVLRPRPGVVAVVGAAVSSRRRGPGRDSAHLAPGRDRQMKLRYRAEELDDITAAAARAGLTPTDPIPQPVRRCTRRPTSRASPHAGPLLDALGDQRDMLQPLTRTPSASRVAAIQ